MDRARRESFIIRGYVGLTLGGIFGAIIIGKLFVEQGPLRQSRLELAKRICPGLGPEQPRPGPICTLEGEIVAKSVLRNAICANPKVYDNDTQREYVATQLSRLTGVAFHRIYPRLCLADRKFCFIVRQAPPRVEEAVMSLDLPGVFSRPEYARVYPHGSLAANAVGYRGIDSVAITGMEKTWDFCLHGTPSTSRENFDRDGRIILGPDVKFRPAEPGDRLVLTIRMPLQKIVEAALDDLWEKHQPVAATCTILDPRTGDILAIAARPTFDPNDPAGARPQDMLCRQAYDVYAPGSTFKPPVIGAALDAGAVTPNTKLRCTGVAIIGGRPLHCWGPWEYRGHGVLTPGDVIVMSCNPGAAQAALALGKSGMYEYIERMHVLETMDSGLNKERPGYVIAESQQSKRGIANIGFGQGIGLTDLHLLAIYGAIANGGTFYYPNVVKEVRSPDGRLIRRREPCAGGRLFKKETCELLLHYLEEAVQRGTGRAAAIAGVRVGGKTGTAQIFDRDAGEFLADQFMMSFIGVAPIEAPRFVVLVRVDRPRYGEHGADTAAPTVRRVIESAMNLSDEIGL